MTHSKTLVACLFVSFGASLAFGCGGDDDTSSNTPNPVSCSDVCQRYADCFDSNYDVDQCTVDYTNDTTSDQEKAGKLQACSGCMSDKSCTSAVFSCATECAPFVP